MIRNHHPNFRRWLWLALSVLSAAGMRYYVAHIWGANQSPQFSDLYASWWATHEVLLHGRNPYTPAVAHEIQTVIYGAPLAASSGDPAGIGGGFAYPLYVVFLMSPTVGMSFAAVEVLFRLLLAAAALVSLWFWLYGLRWRLRFLEPLTLGIFTLGSFPVLQGIDLQNLSLIAAYLVAAAVASLVAERLTLAGMLLALATFKPQFVVLLIPWLMVWAVSDWRRRKNLVWSFLSTLSLLMLASELLVRGWFWQFLKVAAAYRHYTYGHSLLDVWFTRRGGPVVAAVLVVAVLTLCWRGRMWPAKSAGFLFTSSLGLAATLLVIPTLEPHAQLLLLPGFLLLLQYRVNLWQAGRTLRLLIASAWILLAWPWAAAAGMAFLALVRPERALLAWWVVPLYSSPLLPLAVFVTLGIVVAKGVSNLNLPDDAALINQNTFL